MKMYYIVLAIEHGKFRHVGLHNTKHRDFEGSTDRTGCMNHRNVGPNQPDTPPRFGVTTVSNGPEIHLYKWTTNSGWCRHQVRFSMSLSMDRHMLACSESTTM